MNISYNEALKEIRKEARKVGLTFKRKNTRFNGVYLWKLEDRQIGTVFIDNYQFWSAYEDACSGYIASFESQNRCFTMRV